MNLFRNHTKSNKKRPSIKLLLVCLCIFAVIYKYNKPLVVSPNTRPPGAVVIIYEFDQHNDTYFQYLWHIGCLEPLAVKSENSGFGRNWYTGCPKIWSKKYINDFCPWKYNHQLWCWQKQKIAIFFYFFN